VVNLTSILCLIISIGIYCLVLTSYCHESDLNVSDLISSYSDKMTTQEKYNAFVLGGTGGVGKAIVKALAKSQGFSKVTLISRRIVDLRDSSSADDYDYTKFDQKIMDFKDINVNGGKQGALFQGYDVGFYAIGVNSDVVSKAEYKKIELDNALTIAKLIKKNADSLKHLHWVSGIGASENSLFHFGRVKAQAEDEIWKMGFKRVSIYRPGGVITSDNSGELGPKMKAVLKAVDFANCLSIDGDLLGRAIVVNTFRESDKSFEILENADIIKLGNALPE
jgi:NAD(P)-dependent dehydrogenase (short-subunit alcohol dehydrogenase family)